MSDKTLMLPCTCAGCCTIARFERWELENDDGETYVEFYDSNTGAGSLRWRLEQAWKTIRGKREWNHCLLLEDAELDSLQAWISKQRPQRGTISPWVTTPANFSYTVSPPAPKGNTKGSSTTEK